MDVWELKAIKVDNPPEDWHWTCPVGEPIYELYLSVDGYGGGAPLRGAVTREELNRLVESLSRLTAEMIACMGRARQEPKNPRTGRERRVRNIEGTAERRAETGDVEMTEVLRQRGDGVTSDLPAS